jgi:hypothetical protein
MGFISDIADLTKGDPGFRKILASELTKTARDVQTLNVSFKLNGVRILDSYLNEDKDQVSGQVAMSGFIGIRVGMGMWGTWNFKGVYAVSSSPSGDLFLSGPSMSADSQANSLLQSILEEQIVGKLGDMLTKHALSTGNTSTNENSRLASSDLGLRQVKLLMKKHSLPGKLSGSGTKWELEVADAKEKRQVAKILPNVGGYKTGWGGWVFKPGYDGGGDFNDPSSKQHYAAGAVRKKTPNQVFMELVGDKTVVMLVSKLLPAFKNLPADAAAFASDVLEDANFHSDNRLLAHAVPHSGMYTNTLMSPSTVAQHLDWDWRVLAFAVLLILKAGDKQGAAKAAKLFVDHNKDLLLEWGQE